MNPSDTPIVLLHGLIGRLGDAEILAPFGGREVHAPDLLGYGRNRDADTSALSLEDQARHVAGFIAGLDRGPVHLAGHSVGGAVAVLVAQRFPEHVRSLISIEGNFTLKDAFWSAQLAAKSDAEVAEILGGYTADPAAWIAAAGVPVTPWTTALARDWLAHQPATTVKAQARAVVAATRPAEYLKTLHKLMASDLPVCLIAGGRSAEGWDTPDWANRACRLRINIPGVGHLMMAESPQAHARAILTCLDNGEA
ncbi:alpha/beta fold hydrolase [Pelagibius sp.]|uniref:alpha/beta fold hydrolase n=1 Tax=Pelagibius sp. TaxID=1931238 RepID=UPI00261A6615|nr:alpha/beta hydrolase [Pelagibius sp.]